MAAKQRAELLRKSWTEIAEQYDRHLVPRFMPWTKHTLKRFLAQKLPAGSILVPACGPGHELLMLAESFPDDRQIVGIDLAEGMVERANARCEEAGISGRARAVVGNACCIETQYSGAAGVFSLFGLQQLPDAHLALANWVKALAPGGTLAVTFWPSHVEDEGPWQRLADLTTNKPKNQAVSSQSLPARKVSWEEQVPQVALKQEAILLADEHLAFAMHWASMQEFWKVMTEAGPWHARTLSMGSDHLSALKQAFLADCANTDTKPVVHYPHARLIVIQKPRAAL